MEHLSQHAEEENVRFNALPINDAQDIDQSSIVIRCKRHFKKTLNLSVLTFKGILFFK